MSDAARSDDEMRNDASLPPGLPVGIPRAPGGATPEEAEALKLLPYYPSREENPFFAGRADETYFTAPRAGAPRPARRDWRRMAAAASLIAVVAIGAAAATTHVRGLRAGDSQQTQDVTTRLDAMSTRLETLEANRSREETASLKKLVAEIRNSASGTRDVGGAVGQLSARVERLEKEQGARLDKLGDRMSSESATRLADVASRLDKLEAKTAAAVASAAAPAKLAAKTEVAKFPAGVSNETTGAIDRPHPPLRGFRLAEIHNGYAMIDSPAGEFAVAPGDVVPGGGRVLRIERHGANWVVVTTRGQIVALDD